jgi:hypothetical protein
MKTNTEEWLVITRLFGIRVMSLENKGVALNYANMMRVIQEYPAFGLTD